MLFWVYFIAIVGWAQEIRFEYQFAYKGQYAQGIDWEE